MLKKSAFILLSGMLLFTGWKWATYQWWSEVSRDPQSTQLSDCKLTDLADLVIRKQRVPERVLFHFGKKQTLEHDLQNDTVPAEDWNQFIMGDKGRFGLMPFRRGLYGTENLEGADRFGSDRYNGLIAIVLKDECRTPNRTETLWNLPQNPRFQNWYAGKKFSLPLSEWSQMCFEASGAPIASQLKMYDTKALDETTCEKQVNQYFTDLNFAVVQDLVISRSWAIRDRACIQHIYGRDEYWAKEFFANGQLWRNHCDRGVDHRNRTRIWFQTLITQLNVISPNARLNDLVKDLAKPLPGRNYETGDFDFFAVQEFSSAFDEARLRCLEHKRNAEFLKALQEMTGAIESLQSIDIKNELDRTCR